MVDGVLRHLYLGFIRLHILYHAAKEPICGVELMEELQHHGYDVGPGTLYPGAASTAAVWIDPLRARSHRGKAAEEYTCYGSR